VDRSAHYHRYLVCPPSPGRFGCDPDREVLWAMAGDFAGLTNIGGRGGPGGISRGKLVLDFILDPSLDLPDNM